MGRIILFFYRTFSRKEIKVKKVKMSKIMQVLYLIVFTFSASLVFYGFDKGGAIRQKEVLSIANNKAEKYFYDGKYEEAIKEYERLLTEKPDNPMWAVKIAEIYSIQRNLESSDKYLQKAKEIREANLAGDAEKKYASYKMIDAQVADYIIFTELMNKNYEEAMKYGENVLKLYKDDKKIIRTMIPVYMANNRYDLAKELIQSYPVDQASSYDLAQYSYLNMLIDNWDYGLSVLKASWYQDKDEVKVYDVLASMSKYNNDILIEKITKLSEAYPKEAAYKMWLSKIYSMRPETAAKAQQLLDEALKLDAEVGEVQKTILQARIYQNSNKVEQADELMSKLIQEAGQDYRILHAAGLFYYEKGQYNKALEYCKNSIFQNREYADNYGFLMTDILKAMEKSAEGEPYFRTALYYEPFNYNIIQTIAEYYWLTAEDHAKALEYFNYFEIIRPNDAEIKYLTAQIYLQNQNWEEAANVLKKCIQINPNVARYHRSLATIYIKMDEAKGTNTLLKEALAEMTNAHELDKSDILTLNNLGCYHIAFSTEISKSREYFTQAKNGITDATDESIKATILDNYKKIDEIYKKYNAGSTNDNETITIPDFALFY
ncbi:MAG: tetratricopeptide repeat protein [Clostridiales bacterium]|nr:tetratricopeptide repeat protein [Clostridiales bacterium]